MDNYKVSDGSYGPKVGPKNFPNECQLKKEQWTDSVPSQNTFEKHTHALHLLEQHLNDLIILINPILNSNPIEWKKCKPEGEPDKPKDGPVSEVVNAIQAYSSRVSEMDQLIVDTINQVNIKG